MLFSNVSLSPTSVKHRKEMVTIVSFSILTIVLFIFGIINIIQKSYLVAAIDLSLILPSLFGLYLVNKNYNIEKLTTALSILLFILLLLILFIRGGSEYTLVWSFIFAFVVMVLKGTKVGLYYSIAFYTINFIIVYSFIGESITMAGYIRFVAVSMIFVFMAFFYEYTTLNTLNKLNKSISEVEYLNENLEQKVQDEIKKNTTKELLIFEQSKMASMGEMIGNIAHQWRQPLSVISTGATGMMMHKKFGLLKDENFIETCEVINDSAQYLSKTIDDFRNFIKGNSTKTVFYLKETIDSFLHLIDGQLKNNNIKIILDIDENLEINNYENELIQCLINIVNNSKDAFLETNKENRFIFISSFIKDDKIEIMIKDNAGGIPKNVLFKIFEPYFTTKHKSQGTGLGLHMTYHLITEGMKGTIKAHNISYEYNNTKYIGAEFLICLPRYI